MDRHPDQHGPYFARSATGLVRELSSFDSLVFNASFINVGLILTYVFLYIPSFHPGANLLLAATLGVVAAVPMALANAMLASAFPRSGGEYVYNSRILSPAMGFATNFNISLWLLFYGGVSCALFSEYGLSAVFRYLGFRWDVAGAVEIAIWLTRSSGKFIVGTGVLGIVVMGSILSTRRVARVQRWYFLLGVVALIAAVVALFATSQEEFSASFDRYFGSGTLASTLASAEELGYRPAGGSSLLETLVVFFWPASFLFWGNASTYFGGEIKQARRSQTFGLAGAVVLAGLLVLLALAAFKASVGKDLLGAVAFSHLLGGSEGFTPLYSELAAIASSPSVGLLVVVGSTYWTVAFTTLCIGAVTRNLLAWSLDRLAPEALSGVSTRFHTPVWALLLCGFLAEIFLYLYSYVPAFAFMVGVVGAFLTFMMTALSAALLPFLKPQIFESSPVRWRWGPVPVITIVGTLAFLGLLAVQGSVLSDPYSGVSLSPATDAGSGAGIPFAMFLVNVGLFSAGFLVYGLAKAIRKRQGIDVALAFQEIPPE